MRSHSWVYIDYIDYIGHILIVLLCCCYCVIVIVLLLLWYCYCFIVIVLLFLCYWNIGTFEHVISAFNILSAFTFLGWGFGFRTYRYINISIWFMLSEPNISLSYQKVTHWLWSGFNIWTLEFLNVWYLHSTSICYQSFYLRSHFSGVWHLASGIWHLASGIWHLASGIWHLTSGIWHLVSLFRNVNADICGHISICAHISAQNVNADIWRGIS